jgi:O-antigen biosynthesis protein
MRSIRNCVLATMKAARYAVVEPVQLRLARAAHQAEYSDRKANPLVSVVIPTYDRGQLLVERTLPSILTQTYSHLEIIIVGDCSPAATVALLDRPVDPRVQFINRPTRQDYPRDPRLRWYVSGNDATNYGYSLARGKWLAYFDDDDVMTPDHIEALLRFAQRGDYEFVAGLYEEERNGRREVRGHRIPDGPEFGGHGTWLRRSYLKMFRYNNDSWRKSYNRPQDIDCQLRMRRAGVRMELLEQVVSYVLPRPGQSTVGLEARLADAS